MEKLRTKHSIDRTQFEIIVKTMTEDADEIHLDQFLYSCKNLGLDPVMGQIYMQIRWSWNWKAEPKRWDRHLSIQTGIEGLRSLAERQGDYAGQDLPKFYWDDGNGVVKDGPVYPDGANVLAVSTSVYRYMRDKDRMGFPYTAFLKDYAQRTRSGALSGMWEKIGIMLPKCAEAGAFRKGWPQVFKNLYIKEEMQGETAPDVKEAPVDGKKEIEGKDPGAEGKGAGDNRAPVSGEGHGPSGAPGVPEAGGGDPGPDQLAQEPQKPPLSTQQKATEVVNALRDKHKEKAGSLLKDYVAKACGKKKYEEVPKNTSSAVIDLLHAKLLSDKGPSVVAMIDEKMNKKEETGGQDS